MRASAQYVTRAENSKIVVITMTNNELILKHLLDLNIHGLFDNHASLNELNKAVEHVIQGRRYISQNFSSTLAASQRGEPRQKVLTIKEFEVMRLLATGLAGREIAKQVNRSKKTISRQKRSAIQKNGYPAPK